MQLLQPFLTFALAAIFIGEPIAPSIVLFATAVVVTVAISTDAERAVPAHAVGFADPVPQGLHRGGVGESVSARRDATRLFRRRDRRELGHLPLEQ